MAIVAWTFLVEEAVDEAVPVEVIFTIVEPTGGGVIVIEYDPITFPFLSKNWCI